MHLLVLSAFRRKTTHTTTGRRVSMHLLVLSAFRQITRPHLKTQDRSQCTFWCSVLSDSTSRRRPTPGLSCLNAPFGAQCFPTGCHPSGERYPNQSQCTFWCSVLSDSVSVIPSEWARDVSMHLLVLSAFRRRWRRRVPRLLRVSMHLLVLSAFRRDEKVKVAAAVDSLNAPFGAQCFPTGMRLNPHGRT